MISREEGRGRRREREEAWDAGGGAVLLYRGRFTFPQRPSPSSTDTSCALRSLFRTHTHTHTSDPAAASSHPYTHGGGVTLGMRVSVRRDTGPTHSLVCQVPPTSLKQGIWLHSECNREAMWDRRSGTGPFQEKRGKFF